MWIWNDRTIKQRYRDQKISHRKIFLPIFLICLLLSAILLFWDIKLYEVVFISFFATSAIYTFINIFVRSPHVQIPDYYPTWIQVAMYIVHFLLASFVFYLFSVGILQHHFVFFENFVCCDLIKNFPKELSEFIK